MQCVKKMVSIVSIMIVLSILCLISVTPAFAVDTSQFRTGFYTLWASSFGEFNEFSHANTTNLMSNGVTYANEEAYFHNYMSIEDYSNPPMNRYAYQRREVFTQNISRINSDSGLLISFDLKLDMTPLTSLSVSGGLGRTGFVVNVRDRKGTGDREFYYSIAAYGTGIVVTSVGGNRNSLDNQPVKACLFDVNPLTYHNYVFSFSPDNNTTDIYIDYQLKATINENLYTYRTVNSGYYDYDFVAISLVNRTLNSRQTSYQLFEANADCWFKNFVIYGETLSSHLLIWNDSYWNAVRNNSIIWNSDGSHVDVALIAAGKWNELYDGLFDYIDTDPTLGSSSNPYDVYVVDYDPLLTPQAFASTTAGRIYWYSIAFDTGYNSTFAYRLIEILPSLEIDKWQTTFMHEFGHALGIDHGHTWDVMYEWVDNKPTILTPDDIYNFHLSAPHFGNSMD